MDGDSVDRSDGWRYNVDRSAARTAKRRGPRVRMMAQIAGLLAADS
jgi:hypothetical protein